MVRIKPGVSVRGLNPEIVLAVHIAEGVYVLYDEDCWITCGTDGTHKLRSDHYLGNAVDLRTRNIEEGKRKELVKKLEDRLGGGDSDYLLYLHDTHLHMAFRPKGALNR